MEHETNLVANNSTNEVVEICDTPIKVGNTTIFKALMVGAGVAAASATIYVIVRNRKKRKRKSLNDLMVERLQKKGYTVVPPLEDCDAKCESEEN